MWGCGGSGFGVGVRLQVLDVSVVLLMMVLDGCGGGVDGHTIEFGGRADFGGRASSGEDVVVVDGGRVGMLRWILGRGRGKRLRACCLAVDAS